MKRSKLKGKGRVLTAKDRELIGGDTEPIGKDKVLAGNDRELIGRDAELIGSRNELTEKRKCRKLTNQGRWTKVKYLSFPIHVFLKLLRSLFGQQDRFPNAVFYDSVLRLIQCIYF